MANLSGTFYIAHRMRKVFSPDWTMTQIESTCLILATEEWADNMGSKTATGADGNLVEVLLEEFHEQTVERVMNDEWTLAWFIDAYSSLLSHVLSMTDDMEDLADLIEALQ